MRTWVWVEVFPGVWTARVTEAEVEVEAKVEAEAEGAPWVVDAAELGY